MKAYRQRYLIDDRKLQGFEESTLTTTKRPESVRPTKSLAKTKNLKMHSMRPLRHLLSSKRKTETGVISDGI
ncbi:MAG: hypothetical protein JNM93_13500 [Bacteriovoracaceae bacterium]|nr:hypothetical protein [Bacteriovoracaceae bacterium]